MHTRFDKERGEYVPRREAVEECFHEPAHAVTDAPSVEERIQQDKDRWTNYVPATEAGSSHHAPVGELQHQHVLTLAQVPVDRNTYRNENSSAVLSDCPDPELIERPANYPGMPEHQRLPSSPAARKAIPLCTGALDYFPDALIAVAIVSQVGNCQHNAGEPLHWAREKSTDHADCIMRHLVDRGKTDSDGMPHSAKLAWRALALLQEELENNAK